MCSRKAQNFSIFIIHKQFLYFKCFCVIFFFFRDFFLSLYECLFCLFHSKLSAWLLSCTTLIGLRGLNDSLLLKETLYSDGSDPRLVRAVAREVCRRRTETESTRRLQRQAQAGARSRWYTPKSKQTTQRMRRNRIADPAGTCRLLNQHINAGRTYKANTISQAGSRRRKTLVPLPPEIAAVHCISSQQSGQ